MEANLLVHDIWPFLEELPQEWSLGVPHRALVLVAVQGAMNMQVEGVISNGHSEEFS